MCVFVLRMFTSLFSWSADPRTPSVLLSAPLVSIRMYRSNIRSSCTIFILYSLWKYGHLWHKRSTAISFRHLLLFFAGSGSARWGSSFRREEVAVMYRPRRTNLDCILENTTTLFLFCILTHMTKTTATLCCLKNWRVNIYFLIYLRPCTVKWSHVGWHYPSWISSCLTYSTSSFFIPVKFSPGSD